jgi:hypothetical protein
MQFDPHTWRPHGWRSGQAPLDDVLAAALAAKGCKKRGEPLSQAHVDALADRKLLLDCYATPRWVWRLAGYICGVEPGEWCGDPFHNPWSRAAQENLAPDAWRFDGSTPDLDGLRTYGETDDGLLGHKPTDPMWPGFGPILANGPHSANGKWLPLCAAAGRSRIVVAVVPLDVVGWYVDHGMTCDLEVQLGRVDYDPPPGVTLTTGNERCSSLLIWLPHTREEGNVVDAAMIKIKDDRGRVRHCPLRPGLRAAPYVLDYTG